MIMFRSSVNVGRHPEAVFQFLANVDRVQQAGGSPVLALDRTTSEPPRLLEMVWAGPAMTGRDRYGLAEVQDGTKLVHRKGTSGRGLLRVREPCVRWALLPRLEERLVAIKRALEEGQEPIPASTSLNEDL